MSVHVVMMVRNEAGRYLAKVLDCASEVTAVSGGKIIVTDDASTDLTAAMLGTYTKHVQLSPEPLFWTHEGRARQRHLDFVGQLVSPGDWILSLDADETINRPDLLVEAVHGVPAEHDAIGLPLYEFWAEDQYRIDGYWFGTHATRLFRWHEGAQIADKQMASGSEPTYVQDAVTLGRWTRQMDVHLLHWGYLDPADRVRKHAVYSGRLGGHGHSNSHINSIIESPTLRKYQS